MKAAESYHPIQDAIEHVFAHGHVPRVQVDARVAEVPASVRAKWGAKLVLDLDASWPLNLSWSVDGFEADLAFEGMVSRCSFPWRSVYVVLDRETGAGIVIEKHMPAAGIPPRPEEAESAQHAIGKIRSLWRLSNDATTTEAERTSARERATALALKHNIELDRVVHGGFTVTKGGAQRVHNPQADQRRVAFTVLKGGKK